MEYLFNMFGEQLGWTESRLVDCNRLNPEPDQIALSRYARLVERKETPRSLPKWLNQHLRANYVKPFKPDYSMPPVWPWSEGFREPPNKEPDTPFEFVSLWQR